MNTNFTDPEVLGNYIEAAFWVVVGILVFALGRRARPPLNRLALPAAVLFVFFGLSDVVEAQTGAWWRPFWLLLWKGFCIVGLAGCYWKYRRIKKEQAASPQASGSALGPQTVAAPQPDQEVPDREGRPA